MTELSAKGIKADVDNFLKEGDLPKLVNMVEYVEINQELYTKALQHYVLTAARFVVIARYGKARKPHVAPVLRINSRIRQ